MDKLWVVIIGAGLGAYGYHVYQEKNRRKNPEEEIEGVLTERSILARLSSPSVDQTSTTSKPVIEDSAKLRERISYLEGQLEARSGGGLRNSFSRRRFDDYDDEE